MHSTDEQPIHNSTRNPQPRRATSRYGRNTIPVRVVGAGLLVAMAGIHVRLLMLGYGQIPIAPLFLLNGVLGVLAAVALVLVRRRWLAAASFAGAILLAGTLGALLLTLTVGLFGFTETSGAPLIGPTVGVESIGAVLLVVATVLYGHAQARTWLATHRRHHHRNAPTSGL